MKEVRDEGGESVGRRVSEWVRGRGEKRGVRGGRMCERVRGGENG